MNEEVIIRHCGPTDIETVMAFIRDYWSQEHIFANNRSFLEYQHLVHDKFTFIIAEGSKSKKVYGLKGYIESNRGSTPDVWGAIWKTIKSPNVMLGIDMRTFFHDHVKHRVSIGVGLSKMSLQIDNMLPDVQVRELPHFYRLTEQADYRVAEIHTKTILTPKNDQLLLKRIPSFAELKERFAPEGFQARKPYKDLWYIEHRYYAHPIYRYIVYGVYGSNDTLRSLLICREQEYEETKILRLVDFIGHDEDLAKIGNQFDQLLTRGGYEYADFYCYGIDEKILNDFGFVVKKPESRNIIPNYFEPFVRKNIDMFFAATDLNDLYVFKADGDQDRPNSTAS